MEQTEALRAPSEGDTAEAAEQAASQDVEDELTVLRERVRTLETELEARERVGRECEEFGQYFPDVPLQAVPDEVWGRVRSGVPLSAAYALYETRTRREREAAERERSRTAAMSLGIPDEAARDYFSPAEVRAMSPCEVRANYDRIFESMRHWQ
jgi:hypothetical protein